MPETKWYKKKVGPFPLGVWLGVAVVGIGAGLAIRRFSEQPSAEEPVTTDEEAFGMVPGLVAGRDYPFQPVGNFPTGGSTSQPSNPITSQPVEDVQRAEPVIPVPPPPPPPPPPPNPCAGTSPGCCSFGCLRTGSRGGRVSALQNALKSNGFDPGPIDGIFGTRTKSAVTALQSARGLQVDGVAGKQVHCAVGIPC